MKQNIFLILVSIFFLLNVKAVQSQIDYSDFDHLLQKVVKGNNVDYSQLLGDKDILVGITTIMSEISPNSHPEKFMTRNEQLAYWINAYNAFILKIVMENYQTL